MVKTITRTSNFVDESFQRSAPEGAVMCGTTTHELRRVPDDIPVLLRLRSTPCALLRVAIPISLHLCLSFFPSFFVVEYPSVAGLSGWQATPGQPLMSLHTCAECVQRWATRSNAHVPMSTCVQLTRRQAQCHWWLATEAINRARTLWYTRMPTALVRAEYNTKNSNQRTPSTSSRRSKSV